MSARTLILPIMTLAFGLFFGLVDVAYAQDTGRGRALARANCSQCHAIGTEDHSANLDAPPLRTLSTRYDVDSLQESFAEGISVGHPAMPAFALGPADVDALISYLHAIQTDKVS